MISLVGILDALYGTGKRVFYLRYRHSTGHRLRFSVFSDKASVINRQFFNSSLWDTPSEQHSQDRFLYLSTFLHRFALSGHADDHRSSTPLG
jgi:hypothetical protein